MLGTVSFIGRGSSCCPLCLPALDQRVQSGRMRVDCCRTTPVPGRSQKAQALQHFVGFILVPRLAKPEPDGVLILFSSIFNLRKFCTAAEEKLRHGHTLNTDGFHHEWYSGLTLRIRCQGLAVLVCKTKPTDGGKTLAMLTPKNFGYSGMPRSKKHLKSIVQSALSFLRLCDMKCQQS